MINANATCSIEHIAGRDVYGQPKFQAPTTERCCILSLENRIAHTTVRADSSASRGHGDEPGSRAKLMLQPNTIARPGDRLTVRGITIKVISLDPKLDAVTGKVDHYEAAGESWA